MSGRLLTAREVAGRLGVSTRFVYEQAQLGRLPHLRLAPKGPVRFEWSEVETWLESACRQPARGG